MVSKETLEGWTLEEVKNMTGAMLKLINASIEGDSQEFQKSLDYFETSACRLWRFDRKLDPNPDLLDT